MANKTNIFNEIWCDLLFVDRNQEYGAYTLRKESSKRHLIALLLTIVAFSLLMVLPSILKQVIPQRKEKMVEVTSLSDLKLEAKKEQPKEVIIDQPPPPLKTTIKFTPPVIKPDEELVEETELKTQEEVTKSNVAISIADVEGTDDADAVDIADLNQQIVDDTNSTVLVFVEQMPIFPGGVSALAKYLGSSIRYPDIAAENGIEGRVFIQFVVDSKGNLRDIKVVRGIGSGCDEEAIRVVSKMPKWIPGRQNGRTVNVQFSLPIIFKLES